MIRLVRSELWTELYDGYELLDTTYDTSITTINEYLSESGVHVRYINCLKNFFPKIDNTYNRCEVVFIENGNYVVEDRFFLVGRNLPKNVVFYARSTLIQTGIAVNKYYDRMFKKIVEGRVYKLNMPSCYREVEDALEIGLPTLFRKQCIGGDKKAQRKLAKILIGGRIE